MGINEILGDAIEIRFQVELIQSYNLSIFFTTKFHFNSIVLKCADHLESCSVTDVSKPCVTVAAEIPLEDPAVSRSVEKGAPLFRLTLGGGLGTWH